jgi:hypothetical protein
MLPGRLAQRAIGRWTKRIFAMTAVTFGWIFFRATGMEQATAIIGRIFSNWHFDYPMLQQTILQFAQDNTSLAVAGTTLFWIGWMFLVEFFMEGRKRQRGLQILEQSLLAKGCVTVAIFQVIMFFGVLRASSFIYFQF